MGAQLQLRGPLRYRELYQRLGGMELIRRLSTAFYTHVLETGASTSLRVAFAGKVDGVAQAAALAAIDAHVEITARVQGVIEERNRVAFELGEMGHQ